MRKVFILLRTVLGRSGAVADSVVSLPDVRSADTVAGAYDVVVEAWVHSSLDLHELVETITSVPDVLRAIPCPLEPGAPPLGAPARAIYP